MKRRLLIATIVLLFINSVQAEVLNLKANLDKISLAESCAESKKILLNSDEILDSQLAIIVKRASETGNVDLLKLIHERVISEEWLVEKTWEEGLQFDSRLSYGLEVLVERNFQVTQYLKDYFFNSPDVPYDRIKEWDSGYGYRGLQGNLLRIVAKYDLKTFKEIAALTDGDTISHSKKRTIIWAMRHDNSGFSEQLLKSKTSEQDETLKREVLSSLQFLKRKAEKN